VLLLVGPPLRCSLDLSVIMTDASVREVRVFILLSLGGTLTNRPWSCRGER
jgi:hypothetical protein